MLCYQYFYQLRVHTTGAPSMKFLHLLRFAVILCGYSNRTTKRVFIFWGPVLLGCRPPFWGFLFWGSHRPAFTVPAGRQSPSEGSGQTPGLPWAVQWKSLVTGSKGFDEWWSEYLYRSFKSRFCFRNIISLVFYISPGKRNGLFLGGYEDCCWMLVYRRVWNIPLGSQWFSFFRKAVTVAGSGKVSVVFWYCRMM